MAARKKKTARKTGTSRKPAAAARSRHKFLICGIGSSAGGLSPLEVFLRHVPSGPGIAFVVISHHKADHASLLSQLLQNYTDMPVLDADDGMSVERDHVYVSSPGKELHLERGVFRIKPIPPHKDMYLPIDTFLRSLAADRHEDAAGIILSGTGSDGTLGLKAVKAEYGLVMAQSPDSAEYPGMPESAIHNLDVDFILPPEEMPQRLLDYAGRKLRKPDTASAGEELNESQLAKILEILRSRIGRDFSDYKDSSIRRRISRRMLLHQLTSMEEYIQYLQHNAHEIDLLYKELLITVTQFFRDPDAWTALEEKGLPQLLPALGNDEPFRAWVPGCATGEEAYSLAILLHEFLRANHLNPDVQIFATDLDEHSINIARTGAYSQGIAADISPGRLERYFSFEEGQYHVRKDIREMVVFAIQDVTRDPPFLNLDLIACRNLLIYMQTRLQQRILPMFHYALKQNGLLLLGSSETLGKNDRLFSPVDRKWRLFTRREATAAAWLQSPVDILRQRTGGDTTQKPVPLAAVPQRIRDNHLTRLAEHLFVKKFVPPSVIINEEGDIYFIQGRTSPFLEPPSGHPHLNMFDMACRGLRLELVTAVRKAAAAEAQEPVRRTVDISSDEGSLTVDIDVTWLDEPDMLRGLLMVTFRARKPAPADKPARRARAKKKEPDEQKPGRVRELELELQHMRETLQTTVEELETSNEELRASNEELQSTNEELQSTNEELETSKEEMQSLNEELTTVNTELQSKVDELAQVSDDMSNLLNSTGVATLFLDNDLRINRFNRQTTELFKLIASDVGRPLSDLSSNLYYDNLEADAQQVLRNLEPVEREICVKDGSWRQMRLSPYRTSDNAIEGVVITFVDITGLKSAARFSEAARSLADRIVQTLPVPLLILDGDLRVVTSNRVFYKTFKLKPKLVEDELVYEISGSEWDIPELRRLLGEVVQNKAAFEGYRVEHNFPRIGHRVMMLSAKALIEERNRPHLILLVIEDMAAGRGQR